MNLLHIDTQRNGAAAARIVLKGELDISSAGQVEDALSAVRRQGLELLVLDLRQLDFMDSTGLRLIVRADEAAREEGVRFVIVRGPEAVQRVFELVGLDSRLDMADEPPV